MFEPFFHFWEYGHFFEKRLILRKPRVPEDRENTQNSVPTVEELKKRIRQNRNRTRKELDDLRRGTDVRRNGRNDALSHAHGATRELTEPTPDYPKSEEAAEAAKKSAGLMPYGEVQRMQEAHQKIYEHYVNPAFMLYLKQTGKADAVFMALDQVLKEPENFSYRLVKGDFHIVKRRPYTQTNLHIRNDFLIVMKTADRRVARVNDVSLEDTRGRIPWMENPRYNAEMPRYRKRWASEVNVHGLHPKE